MQLYQGPIGRAAVVAVLGIVTLSAPPATAQTCVGDCNNDHRVIVSELVTGVNLALTGNPVTACLLLDVDSNGRIAVNELVAAVSSALHGCPATFSPTPLSTPTRTDTFTVTPTRTFTQPPGPSSTPTTPPTPTQTPTFTPTVTPTPTIEPPSLTCQVSPDRVAPGETTIVSLTLTNHRPQALTGGIVRALIPVNGVALVVPQYIAGGGTCPQNSCTPGQSITWNIGTLLIGGSKTVNFPLTVLSGQTAPADGTELTVNCMGSADGTITVNRNVTAIVDSMRPLSVAIDVDKDAVPRAGTLRYSLYFGNRSVTPQNSATLTFAVPPGTTVQSISDGGIEAAGFVTWNLGNLAAGVSGVREVVVSVDNTTRQGDTLVGNATFDAGGNTVHASVISHVQTSPTLIIAVGVNPDPVEPGASVVVDVTVTNQGLDDLAGVQAGFRTPPQVAGIPPVYATQTITCNSGASFNCDPFERAIWTIGTLAAGQGITLSFPATVLSGQSAPPNGSLIPFAADVVANNGAAAQTVRNVLVRTNRPLDIEIDAMPRPIGPDEDLHYTLLFGNRSTGTITAAAIAMPLPEGTTLASNPESGVVTEGVVTWPLGDLPPGTSGTRELVVHVANDATEGSVILAQATLTGGNTAARAHTVTPVQSNDPLTINLTLNPDPVTPGEALIAVLTVTNRGLTGLFAVAADLRTPEEVTPFAPAFANDTVRCTTGASFNCDNLERAVWTIGDLVPGQAKTLSVPIAIPTGQTAPPPGTVISFDARALANDGSSAQTRRSVPVRAAHPLDLEIDATPQPAEPGANLRYTLTFGNRGTTLLAGGVLMLPVPLGTTVQSTSDDGTIVNGIAVWTLPDLAAGATGVRELVVQVDNTTGAGTPLLADATLTAGNVTQRGHIVVPVDGGLPLTVNVTLGPNPITAGEAMDITLNVTNRSPLTLFEVGALLRVPPEIVAIVPAFANDTIQCRVGATFNCDSFELLVWTVGTLAPGQGATLSLATTVLTGQSAPPPGSVIRFEGFAGANDGTQVLTSTSMTIHGMRSLELDVDAVPDAVAAGSELDVSLDFGNRGTGMLAGTTLALPLPDGTSLQAASDGGTLADGVITWSLPDLAPGASGKREVVLDVSPTAVEGLPITSRAVLAAGGAIAYADAYSRVQSGAPLGITVDVQPDPVMQGQALLVTLTITNHALVNLFNVAVNARVPIEVTPFAVALTGTGQCRVGPTFGCDNLEMVRWAVGTMTPGQMVMLTMPPPVPMGANAPPDGTLISFEADAAADDGSRAYARPSVAVQ